MAAPRDAYQLVPRAMSTQVAVRLPDDLVEYVDALVDQGAGSRSAVVVRALTLYRQQLRAEPDARTLEKSGDYDDFDDLVRHAVVED